MRNPIYEGIEVVILSGVEGWPRYVNPLSWFDSAHHDGGAVGFRGRQMSTSALRGYNICFYIRICH